MDAAQVSEAFALIATEPQSAPIVGEAFALVSYGPAEAKYARVGEAFALIPYIVGTHNTPRASQHGLEIVYTTGVPDQRRSRCWWFTFDGHTMYVMDLGPEGTFVYDTTTKQWSRWYTDGFEGQWNMKAGTVWGALRIVAGDAVSGEVWVIDPNNPMDEGWRVMSHVVTGGIMLRGRVYIGLSALRLAGSAGQITDDTGTATINMRFSDDMGKTWSDYYPLVVTEGDYSDETAWRSLGSFMEPGRLLEISDEGAMIRIDTLDADMNGFDEPPQPALGTGRGG